MDTPKANEVHHEEVVQLGREEVVPLHHVPEPASSIRDRIYPIAVYWRKSIKGDQAYPNRNLPTENKTITTVTKGLHKRLKPKVNPWV